MPTWLKRFWTGFRAWRKANAEAHAKAKTGSCCSNPRDIYAAHHHED